MTIITPTSLPVELTTATTINAHSFKTWQAVLLATIMVMIMIMTIIGNLLVCLCIYWKQEMRSVTSMFLVNLAVADLGTGLFSIPMAIATMFEAGILHNKITCYLNASCIILFFIASINTMVATSIYKYLTVGFPMNPKMGKRGALTVIFLIWLVSILLAFGPVFGWNNYYLLENRYQCSPRSPMNANEYSHLAALLFFGYAFPLPVMIICYARVYFISKSHFKRMRRNTTYDVRLLKSEAHLIGTLWIVVVVFLLCWLPFVVYLVLGMAKKEIPVYLPIVAFMFGYSNSSVNPLVYAARLASFRKGFKEIILSCFRSNEMEPAYLTYNKSVPNGLNESSNTNDTLRSTLPKDAFKNANLAYVLQGSDNKSFVVEDGEHAYKSRKISRYRISETKMYPRDSNDHSSGKMSLSDEDNQSQKLSGDRGDAKNDTKFQETVAVFDYSNKNYKSRRFSLGSKRIPRLYPRISRDESANHGVYSQNSEFSSNVNEGYSSNNFDEVIEEGDTCDGIELEIKTGDMASDERNRIITLTETRYEMFSKVLRLCENLQCESPLGEYQISREINARYDIHVITNPAKQEINVYGVPCIHKVIQTLSWEDVAFDSLGNVAMKTHHDVFRNKNIDTKSLPLYMREHVRLEV